MNSKFEISNTRKDLKSLNFETFEFCFQNLFNLPIDIYYENLFEKGLNFLTTLEPSSHKFVYPKSLNTFIPGTILYSKISGDKDYLFKPYVMNKFDYFITFGEISTDFLHSTMLKSTRYEILNLHIENKSLKPYNVFYGGKYLGRVEPYHPSKFKLEYSLDTSNFGKHFQIPTWIEFRMEIGMPHLEKSQFIQLDKVWITDVNVGDVVGRNECYL